MFLREKLISLTSSVMTFKFSVAANPVQNLFAFATKWEVFLMFIAVLCSIGTGLLVAWNLLIFGDLVGAMVSAELINAFESMGMNTTGFIATDIMDSVTTFAVGNAVVGSVMLALAYVSIFLFNYTSQRQIFRVRTMYFRSILHQDISWYDVTNSGEIASRLTEDMIKYEDGIGEKFIMFLHNVFSIFGCMTLAFYSGWKLALVCMAPFPVMVLIIYTITKATSAIEEKKTEVYALAGSIAEEALSAIRTVFAFGGEKTEYVRYTTHLYQTYRNNIKKSFLCGLQYGLLWFFIYMTYSGAFRYGVNLILEERHLPFEFQVYTPKSMATIFFSVMMVTVKMNMAAMFTDTLTIAKVAAVNIFSVIKQKSTIDSSSSNGLKPKDFEGEIEFKNVSFRYPSRPFVKILDKLSFTVNKGETVAVVGNSGCGKSTCIQLVQRFYDTEEGQILIDGLNIQNLNVKWFRSHIGVVAQEPILFDTTVAENIRFGDVNATIESIILAAKEANAHDFIMKLPNQYNTLVGEGGTNISGGQKQRIAIARALIRNPRILLLDEATSALDTRSEAKVEAALNKVHRRRTTIIVAHRLSTIRRANKIIVLSNGIVVETGNHDYLMTLKGHYYSLVTAQTTDFIGSITGELKKSHCTVKDQIDNESTSTYEILNEEDDILSKEASTMKILSLNKREWPYLIPASLSSIIVGCSPPVFSVLFGDVVGELADPDPEEIRSRTNIYCIYFVAAGIIIAVANFIQIFLFGVASECLTLRLRGLIFKTMLRQETGWFDNPSNGTGALCSKLSTDAATVQGATGLRIGTMIQSFSTILLAVGLSIYYDWRLGLVGTAFVPVILVTTYLENLMFKKEMFNYHKNLETSTKIAVEAVSNIRTIVSLGAEEICHNSYIEAMIPSFELANRNSQVRGLVFALAMSSTYFTYAACMYYGGYLINTENLHYSSVFKVSQALITGTVMVANASALTPNFQKGLQAAGNIIALLEREPKIQNPMYAAKNEECTNDCVKYKNVVFEYPTRSGIRVLDDLNLDVPSGKTVALIGASGCGKSTIMQLLEKFYTPISGTVEMGNKDLNSRPQSFLRMQLGLVSQEPTLFARSITENIAYGDNTRQVPMLEIIAAAKKANVHDFISSLPLGYETKLGDRGTQLSGGQKQRIAIARALIRNPKILLLDEATSALDSESEKIVQAALDKSREDRTCILIAHRLSTVENADKICVLSCGQVVESGTHKELIAKKGMYYESLCLQNGRR